MRIRKAPLLGILIVVIIKPSQIRKKEEKKSKNKPMKQLFLRKQL